MPRAGSQPAPANGTVSPCAARPALTAAPTGSASSAGALGSSLASPWALLRFTHPGQRGHSAQDRGEPPAAGKGPEHPGQSNVLVLRRAAMLQQPAPRCRDPAPNKNQRETRSKGSFLSKLNYSE